MKFQNIIFLVISNKFQSRRFIFNISWARFEKDTFQFKYIIEILSKIFFFLYLNCVFNTFKYSSFLFYSVAHFLILIRQLKIAY